MGTKVHSESYSRVFCSMRDLNEDSSSSSWPHFYGDKSAPFQQYNNGYMQRTAADGHQEHERDALKQKMLEHEAVFKNQVCELHRLYQIQRNMMEEAKRRDVHGFRPSTESSSCLQGPRFLPDSTKWNAPGFPQWTSFNGNPSSSNAEIFTSSLSLTRGNCAQFDVLPLLNPSKEENLALSGRPMKVRKTFSLHLPSDDYIDIEEGESFKENSGTENATRKFLVDCSRDASCLRGSVELVDLNEPVPVEGASAPSLHFLDFTSQTTDSKGLSQQAKAKGACFGVDGESTHLLNGFCTSPFDGKLRKSGYLSHTYEPGISRSMRTSLTQSNQLDRSPFPSDHPHFSLNRVRTPPGYNCLTSEASSFPFLSCFPAPSMAKPGNGFMQLTSAGVVNPVLDPLPQKLFASSCSRVIPAWQGESTSNGFFHGSSSGFKEPRLDLQQSGFDSADFTSFRNDQLGNSAVAIDLNIEAPRSPSDDEVVILEDLCVAAANTYQPEEDHKQSLSWLKSKPSRENELKSTGFCVFDRRVQENELSSVASTSGGKSASCLRNSTTIDINVALDPDDVDEEHPVALPWSRGCFDLNRDFCEDLPALCAKKLLEIDLEAPCKPECDEDNPKKQADEALRSAAEVVLAMSSSWPRVCEDDEDISFLSPEASIAESLLLFADAVAASEAGMDEFEAMTLQLKETWRENCMISLQNVEETASTSRPRRGQTRRGRQRRDFQRDILPGLASLSRHEVTEDLQIFGGLMRARGHCWSPGSMRRRSGGRGRGRAVMVDILPQVQQINAGGAVSEDRDLGGWGKTTRRPRRQRCPGGNASVV